jgi:hypothetical protein
MEIEWTVNIVSRETATGYIYEANAICTAKDMVHEIQNSTSITVEFPGTPGPGFIPYEDVTQEEVLSWVFEKIGEDIKLLKEKGAENLNNQSIAALNPVTQDGVPWPLD